MHESGPLEQLSVARLLFREHVFIELIGLGEDNCISILDKSMYVIKVSLNNFIYVRKIR